MFFLLKDASRLREASVSYVSDRLADYVGREIKELEETLPGWLEQGMNEEELDALHRKWKNKEAVQFTAIHTSSDTDQKEIYVRLTPAKKGEGQLLWEGDCSTSKIGFTSADEDELTGVLFRQLFDNLPNAAVLLDFQSNVIQRANKGFGKLFGYEPDLAKGSDIDELIVPDDEDPIPQEELYQTGRSSAFTKEARRETKTGEKKEVLLTAAPVRFNGEVRHMFVIYFDITETKRLQEELNRQKQLAESVIEGLPDTFYMFDENNRVVNWNGYVNEVTGYTDKEIKEMDPLDLIVEEDRDKTRETIERVLKEGTATLETKLLTKEGEEIPYYLSGRRFEGEEKLYVIAFGTNIAEMKTIENKLREANKDKEVLLDEIHHRVKNNLSHISSILQLQSYNTDSEEVHSVLQDSQARIQSIAMIHDQLYQHESFKEVRMDHYVERLAQTIKQTWASDEKDISYHIETDQIVLPVKEAVTCGSLINELITNATKHAFVQQERGNVWVEVTQKNGDIKILVADDGVGLPDDFSLQSDNSLGVNLINTFARQLNADLSYESGERTEFKIAYSTSVA